jgi:hypothetical protein
MKNPPDLPYTDWDCHTTDTLVSNVDAALLLLLLQRAADKMFRITIYCA